jgi:eukaryotic translation initiation factor 2C
MRSVFWEFVKRNAAYFGQPFGLLYDDASILFALKDLQMDANGQAKFEMENFENNFGKKARFSLVIKPAKKDKELLNSNFTAMNLLLTQYARYPHGSLYSKVFCEMDRIYFLPSQRHQEFKLNAGMQLLTGLRTAVKKGPGGKPLINMDVTHSAFTRVKVEILQLYALAKRGRELTESELKQMGEYSLNRDQREDLKKTLNGLLLKTTIGLPATYRFTGIIDATAKSQRVNITEKDDNGKETTKIMTVEEYYAKKYKTFLRFPLMPLIQCGPKEKCLYFPIEALIVSDRVQRIRRKLPPALQDSVTRFTSKEPKYRFDNIRSMTEDAEVANDPFLKSVNMDIQLQMLKIEGRVLPTPKCEFTKDFKQQMNSSAVSGPPKDVVFSTVVVNRAVGDIKNSYYNLVDDCVKRGIRVAQRYPLESEELNFNQRSSPKVLADFLRQRMEKAKQAYPNATLVLIVVLGGGPGDDDIYKMIKTECELRLGVMTQVILRKTFINCAEKGKPGFNSVTRNIFLKINAKVGGVNNVINQALNWNKFTDKKAPTLFIGADVTHPAPGDTDFPSIAALVGNVDINAVKYTASVRVQMGRMEEIFDMTTMAEERIRQFYQANKILPAHIMYWRDGVSDSQLEMVTNIELNAIRKACKKVRDDYDPNFTVIIVQKRHSTRFYAPNDHRANKDNVPPGTVVDRFITNEDNKDFFLCAHKGMLGTSRPARYLTIYDDWDLTADDLEMCAYVLCHLFQRAAMPVSLPAPVYYAHLVCYRARHHMAALMDQNARNATANNALVVTEALRSTMYFC